MTQAAVPQGGAAQQFQFTGAGGEYFRIWIVNLALSIITLGIYSAWAKVRRLQYFYRNTAVAGASFDYHGEPVAILKGRMIALVLFLVYKLAPSINPIFGLVAAAALGIVMPWLLLRSLKFRLHNTSYRGLRFAFHGATGGAYRVFVLWPVLSFITAYLLGPLWHQRFKAWQHSHSAFGGTRASFDASAGSFYRVYLGALLLVVVVAVVTGAALIMIVLQLQALGMFSFRAGGPSPHDLRKIVFLGFFAFAMMVFMSLFIWPYVTARIQNLVWNHTSLGPHRFRSEVSARRLTWVALGNFFLTALTLGLYKPFADIRLARCRLDTMALLPVGSLNEFIAAEGMNVAALGDAVGEFFDFDIAL